MSKRLRLVELPEPDSVSLAVACCPDIPDTADDGYQYDEWHELTKCDDVL